MVSFGGRRFTCSDMVCFGDRRFTYSDIVCFRGDSHVVIWCEEIHM